MSDSSDNEIEFNQNNHGDDVHGEDEHEQDQLDDAQDNWELGNGDDERHEDGESRSPNRRRIPRRNDNTLRVESRRRPYVGDFDRNRYFYRPSVVITPESYTGDDDWEQYISHFEDCAELGNWTEKEKVLTLAAKLKGQARVFYTSLSVVEKRSYRSLVARLEQRFGSAKQHSRWISRLQSRVRRPGESIAALGDDLLLMAQKAYMSLDANAQEMLALQQFYKAVPLEMRCRIMDRDCASISEAVDVVERYEELLNDYGDKKRTAIRAADKRALFDKNQSTESTVAYQNKNQNTETTAYSDGKINMYTGNEPRVENDASSINKTLMEVVQRLERLERNRDKPFVKRTQGQRQPRTCFLCQSPEHFFRQCPKYLSAQAGNAPRVENMQAENYNQSLQ